MALAVTTCITTASQSSKKFCKCALASSFGLPQNGLAYTILMRLDLSSKLMSPILMLAPVATLAVEGTENSRRVFSVIASGTVGAFEPGFFTGRVAEGRMTRGCKLLTSLTRFHVQFSSREKPVIHYPYFLPDRKIEENIKSH